jgi:xanthine dehydrogenase accessory factor
VRSIAASGTLAAILTRIGELRSQRTPYALCVVAHTEGSSYRKPGAVALVTNDGRDGVISGGCLEADLELYARQALVARTARCVVFDTMNDADLVFGSGSGCRGRMHVLILPDHAPCHTLSDALLAADEQHVPLELALFLDGANVGCGLGWFGPSEMSIGASLESAADARAASHGVHQWPIGGADVRLARFRVGRVPRLVLVGAGPEAAPLLEMARVLGWRTLLIDHRPAAVQALSPLADETLVAQPADGLARCPDAAIDACVVMTHTASNDLAALRALQHHPVRYVGLLGPPRRRDELLHLLGDEGTEALNGRLHAPVGLDLGGQGPESLALAIAAELQRYFAEQM